MSKTKPQLTKANVKMIGVPAGLRDEVKELSERDGIPMYLVVRKGIDLYKAVHSNGKPSDTP